MNRAFICAVMVFWAMPACSQRWVNPAFEGHRLDLRDLGYPEVNQVPAHSSAITSLVAASNGRIYGGTSGQEAYLFVYDPSINKVRHLGKLKGQPGIHHALVEDRDGSIYAGSGLNLLRPLELTKNIPNARDSISNALWADVRKPYRDYAGGHLYRYHPSSGDKQVLLADAPCPAEDLGVPIPNNGIYALAINPQTRAIYGISYPDGHLFEYQIASKKFRDLGELHRKVVFHGPERDWRSLPRALVMGDSGKVYTSGEDGFLVYYDPALDKVQSTGLKIPGEYYPVQAYTGYPVVEYFAKDVMPQSPGVPGGISFSLSRVAVDNGPDKLKLIPQGYQHPPETEALPKDQKGLIYGGSSDGYLFSFDPAAQKLVNLGKPRVSRRLRALTGGKDGRVYMIAGERIEPCRLFSFDPQGGGFQDLGILAVDRSPYYSWRGYQFDAMVTGADGTIYVGESERRSHLFLYIP